MKLSALREYVRVVYGLLKNETIEWEFEGERKKIRFLNPEFGMINIRDKIPLHISAFAPKARQMTAEIADGWITFSSSTIARCGGPPRNSIRHAARPAAIRSRCSRPTSCSDACSSPANLRPVRARRRKPARWQSFALHGMVEATIRGMLPPQMEQLATAYREQYATYQPADAKYLQMHKMHLLRVRPEEEKFSHRRSNPIGHLHRD